MKRALIPAFLLLLGGPILGATVLHEPVARAAAPIASVFVTNDASSPMPVREQNLDANGNIKVHEQGTANVNVTNSSLLTTAPQSATATFVGSPAAPPGSDSSLIIPSGPIDASLISITSMQGTGYVVLENGPGNPRLLFDTDGDDVVLPLTQPVRVDRYTLHCVLGSPVSCGVTLNVAGR